VAGGSGDPSTAKRGLSGHVVWVDAQLPPSLAHWLTSQHGERASHVQDLGLLHESDGHIFDAAVGFGEPVVLVTKDADFIDLLHHRGPPPIIVWLRTGNVTNRDLRRIISGAWARTTELILAGETLVEIIREAAPTRDEDV